MKFRKLFLVMAAAVAVLAVPASASAAEFLKEGKPFSEAVEMKLSGGEVIETGGGVMLCESNLTIATEGGSSGTASYAVKPASCAGLAGNLEGCTVSEAKSTGTPLTIDVNAADLTATGFNVSYTFAKGCAVETIELSFPELTLVPEEASSIRLFEWSTEGPGKVNGEAAEIGYFGSSSFPEEEFGIYGIG